MKKRANPNEVERFFPSYEEGLSFDQVKTRNNQGLNNKIKDDTKKQYIEIIIKNLLTFYNILLFGIGVFLLIAQEWTNCFFMVVVLANTLIGLIQDLRAKYKRDKLSLFDYKKVDVIRYKETNSIKTDEIVLDDILRLKAGDQIPCDSVVLSGSARVDESILTGESLPVSVIAGSKLLSGSYVLSGSLFVKVMSVGVDNYANKIQSQTKDYKTPKSSMYLQLNKLFKIISSIVIFLGLLTAASKGITNDAFKDFEEFNKNIAPIAGALISMIPSGMYLLISTTLTVGVINLSNKKVLVQDMYSIETLARCDVLCLDKTGTITDGNMSVYEVNVLDTSPFNEDKFNAVISSYLDATNDDNFTAKALANHFGKKEIFNKVKALQFNTYNKYSSATLEEIGTITIGAYGFVPLKEDARFKYLINDYSKKGYRVLVVAHSKKSIEGEKSPANMTPIAIILIQDHIRTNAKEIIGWFNDRNVNIKIISGDNALTVEEVAHAVGVKNADKYISLEGLSDDEVKKAALEYNVFGRVTPEQKKIIIDALKEAKHTVGMFGDGVNDLLAIKASNVSITVGSANRAAKDISNIILYNNDFGTLPDVIAQGRRVINNLQRTCSLFLIKTLFAILINVFFLITTVTIHISYPFEPSNFYGWDVICIGVAAFLLALEKNNEEIVKGSFLKNIFKSASINGTLMALAVMLLVLHGKFNNYDLRDTVTIAVYFMSIASFVSLFGVSFPFDKYRVGVFIFSLIATAIMFVLTYITPWNILKINTHMSWSRLWIVTSIMIGLMIILCLVFYLFVPWVIKKIEKRKE